MGKNILQQISINKITIIAVALFIFLNFIEYGKGIQKYIIAETPGIFYWVLTPFMIGTFSLWIFTKVLKLKIKVSK